MADYLKDYSPETSFIQEDGTVIVVQENLKTVIKPKRDMKLNPNYINRINWNRFDVDIKKSPKVESEKGIQFNMRQFII